MSACGLLSNPSLFSQTEAPFIGKESAELISYFVSHKGGAAISSIKGHLFRLWAPAFPRYREFSISIHPLSDLKIG